MAQSNLITRERRVLIGAEGTFQTLPSMHEAVFSHDEIIVDGLGVEMLDNMDARVRREDAIVPVAGLQRARDIKLPKMLLKATKAAAQLTPTGGTVTELSPRILLRSAFGTEHAALGTTVATGSSTTAFDVASASTLEKGDLITVAGEWTMITNISGSTVTVSPALSTTPSTSDVVKNLYNFCPAESHTNTIAVQVAFVGDATQQYTALGCYGNVSFEMPEFGKLPSMTWAGKVTSFAGPTDQSIATTSVTDDMGAPMIWTPSVYIVPTASGVTRSSRTVVESIAFTHEDKWEEVRDGGATQTVAGVVNTGGRASAGKVTWRQRYDNTVDATYFAGGVPVELMVVAVLQTGTGSSASFWIWQQPRVVMTAKPKIVKVGERTYMDCEAMALQDSTVTRASETGADLDRILATTRVAFG